MRHGFVALTVFLIVFQASVFAVLKAEGGSAVPVPESSSQATEVKSVSQPQQPAGVTSRVPRATRAYATMDSRNSPSTSANAPSAQTSSGTSKTMVATASTTTAASLMPKQSNAVTSQGAPAPTNPVPQISPLLSSQSGQSKSQGFLGCVVAGILRKDLTINECNEKGGKALGVKELVKNETSPKGLSSKVPPSQHTPAQASPNKQLQGE